MNIRKNAKREIRILKENNYYNLINGYKHLFLDRLEMGKEINRDKGDIFLTGTKPSELHAVLKFDNTLRSLFLKELLTIEDKVKHAIVQSFYENFENENLHKQFEYTKQKYYNTKNTYYVKKTNKKIIHNETRFEEEEKSPIRTKFIHESEYKYLDRLKIHKEFASIVTKSISEQKNKKQSIKSYELGHGYVPFWILTNILTFGNISNLFVILSDEVAFKTLDKLGIKHNNSEIDIYNMYVILGILSLYRNICAHNERFICTPHSYKIDDYFMNYGRSVPYHKDPNNNSASLKSYQKDKRKDINKKLYPLIFGIMIFYNQERKEKFIIQIERELSSLGKKLKTIDIAKVKKDIGINFDLLEAIDKIQKNQL